MKILSLEMENFRNHTENERFELGDMTFISGHNGTGKTTMAHAVCYVLYGVNYYGLQKIERIINEKANSVKVKLEFMDQDGEVHTLIRARKADKGRTSIYICLRNLANFTITIQAAKIQNN